MVTEKKPIDHSIDADVLADFAVQALLEEVRLTPKPGLVDYDNNGCHFDLNLSLMELSANTLRSTFKEMAQAVRTQRPSQQVREILAMIGRDGERKMLAATGNVNTHKGAIWTLGLITGAAAMLLSVKYPEEITTKSILNVAGQIAVFQDRYVPKSITNGSLVRKRYSVRSAREEAAMKFPSLQNVALPALANFSHEPQQIQRLNVLLSLMAITDDTCILNRSDMEVLDKIKATSNKIVENGGMGKVQNRARFQELDRFITENWVSPGGSADLLAAVIYLEKITDSLKK
ncbi:triphosphoribosyl-dephospho-CoA synthase MdcB [Chryseobacterium carnipullorum]|uniref:triphosphoribosyl-dephospho-CoA synthase n=1 Tax=Chryseobacterium carnipullorum TaxID=1124835 RepID=A0A376DRS1_CHRCU|nr:triphosphoribosyl-dephospho-CoA synthase [Chryseobacterium carnipullorum]AZA49471.1 triphosphoribosyl-dephospho-CoA synthase MdcB [Chryseobacterium carnipullorum]AZA64364.1 triphosphoribosyl-dephospho-CoA synthase MdcB [Chryseobacterium carnipullorum]STC94416.1 triphosphoribosyl-dephospho-CoA synthase [Chryseobacterium carnipullorum]